MSDTRKAFCNQIWCDAASDLPAAGQFVGQIAWINDATAVIKRWDGAVWVTVTPTFGAGNTVVVEGSSGSPTGSVDTIVFDQDDFVVTIASSTATISQTAEPPDFSPLIWLKADALGLNDNDPVTTWTDSSGNGNDLGQSTAGKKPTFKTNILNSLPVVRFDGGDCLTRASIGLSTFVVIACFRCTNTAGMIYEHGPSVDSNSGSYLYTDNGGGAIAVNRSSVWSSRNIGSLWGVQDEFIVVAQYFNGPHETHTFILSGTTWAWIQGILGGGDPGTGTVTDTINVGARDNAASLGITGDIAELIVFTPAISRDDMRKVIRYVQTKYNL